MLLHIDDNTLVTDVQDDFSDSFPLLKIEFYDDVYRYNEKAAEAHHIMADNKIGAIRKIHNPGNLEIMSWYTTGRLERDFKEKFGLNVQVFRKENGGWAKIARTDPYTLAEQMERARNSVSSVPRRRKQTFIYDYL